MKKNNSEEIIINKIEEIRKKNNINWMNILRIAMKNQPDLTKKVLNRINKNDRNISKLLSNLASNSK